MELPKHVSESVRRRNPEIYGPALAGLQNPQRKQDQRSKSEDRQLERGQKSMGFVVSIISIRKRLVDEHDNLRIGAKSLVDVITSSLGFCADNDPRLSWEYGQIIGKHEGTIVKITLTQ